MQICFYINKQNKQFGINSLNKIGYVLKIRK